MKQSHLQKLINQLDDNIIYLESALEHIQSYLRKDGFPKKYPNKKTLMSRKAFSLNWELEDGIKIAKKIAKYAKH